MGFQALSTSPDLLYPKYRFIFSGIGANTDSIAPVVQMGPNWSFSYGQILDKLCNYQVSKSASNTKKHSRCLQFQIRDQEQAQIRSRSGETSVFLRDSFYNPSRPHRFVHFKNLIATS
jgi:hypothetical protein